ncbi:hypothetical protein SAY86_025262 [Trapa natans]|uniref:WRKY domain-containing protein n=1 Tax=Trapa natans TaxID=22666 RepID=A0AAN7MIP5_TRANT|nr:hypothetical protein SAY86_025262 [Trapa natans]
MESLNWQEKLPQATIDFSSHRRVIGQLADGRELAVQLQTLLCNEPKNHGSASMARDVVEKILKTFSDSIYMLSAADSSDVSGSDDGGSVESGASKKRSYSSGLKNGRGCYKRRNRTQTWIEVSTTFEDNHAWRKYGQKEILNAKFPRCYYRCTHKHDQGCKAMKQVQQLEHHQQMYQITYIGEHTCLGTSHLSPQLIVEANHAELSDISKPQNSDGHFLATSTQEQGYSNSKVEEGWSHISDKTLATSKLEMEPVVDYDCGFDSLLDMDFLGSFMELDNGDFVFKDMNNAL